MALSLCNTTIDAQGRELIEHGNTAFPIACYHDDIQVDAVPWHWHEELEAAVITEGQLLVTVGSEKKLLKKGDAFFINSGILHAVWKDGNLPGRLHSVVFHPRLVGGSIDSIIWNNYLQPLIENTSFKYLYLQNLKNPENWETEVREKILEAWEYCVQEPDGYEFQVRNALSRMIFLLHKHCLAGKKSMPTEKELRENQRIKTMLQYIHAHFSEEITIKQIAASTMISSSECLRCFHNTIGSTPIRYLKQYRMQQAAQLLQTTNQKITEIGEACGYQEMSYFAKTFREICGCTPSEYRKKSK